MPRSTKFWKTVKPGKKKNKKETLLVLIESTKANALRMENDAQKLLKSTECILKADNTHYQILSRRYRDLQETVEGLDSERFYNKTLKQIRTEVLDLDEEVKGHKEHFDNYYSELLKTCIEALEGDSKLVKEARKRIVFQEWKGYKEYVDNVFDQVKKLKKSLKKDKWLQPFHLFWPSFVMAHHEVKILKRVLLHKTSETFVEQYLEIPIENNYAFYERVAT